MRKWILMKMGRGWRIYLDRLLHVGLLELVRLVELTDMFRFVARLDIYIYMILYLDSLLLDSKTMNMNLNSIHFV